MNIGDRVRIIKRVYSDVHIGEEGTVVSIDRNHNRYGFDMLRLDGPKHTAFWEYEVEPLEAQPLDEGLF